MQSDHTGLRKSSCPSVEDNADSVSTASSNTQSDKEEHDHGAEVVSQTKRHVLILDLDETIVRAFAENPKIPSYGDSKRITYTDCEGQLHVSFIIARPHLRELLYEVFQHYRIFIYTAGLAQYAQAIIEALDISQYITGVYSRDQCKNISESFHQKDIFSFGFDEERLVFVDDWQEQTRHAPENSLTIKIFNGKKFDTELTTLKSFLLDLSKQEDVRSVSKRYAEFTQRGRASASEARGSTSNKQSLLARIRQPIALQEVNC